MQKSKTKNLWEVFPCGFPIPVIKRAEKVNDFLFCGQGRGKM